MEPTMAVIVSSGQGRTSHRSVDRLRIQLGVKEYVLIPTESAGQLVLRIADVTDGVDNMTIAPTASNAIHIK